MLALNGDFETRGTVDLNVVGAHVYAMHPDTRALCFNYSFDKGKTVKRWRIWAGEPMPDDLWEALHDPEFIIEAWNANFERLIFWYVLKLKDKLPIERFHCTMARARSMALPGKLELCAKALNMPQQKSDNSMMLKWCRPLPEGGWAQDPAEYEQLLDYCDDDVRTECALSYGPLRPLSDDEWRDYHINEAINDRGIPIDTGLAQAAQVYAKAELEDICARLTTLTKGRITSPKQFARIKKWLAEYLPEELQEFLEPDPVTKKVSFDGPTREELLGDDYADLLVGDVREFVELVDDGGRASTAKFAAMLARAGDDQRLRGALVFNGAAQTGRFSSTGVQVHNLVRDKLENIEAVVEGILARVSKAQLIDLASYRADGSFVFDKGEPLRDPYNVLTILSRTLRPSIVADEGKCLVWGDWSSIEAVVNPWLSKENSASELLDYFASGKDLYLRQAVLTYGLQSEDQVTKQQRQAGGKVPVLSFGFGGGAGAGMRMAKAYGVDMDHTTADMLKVTWRRSNPWAERFWVALELAAFNAVRNPEQVFFAGRVAYMCAQDVLWCLLPSGRMLAYPFPKIETINGRFGPQETVTAIKGSFRPKKGSNYWPRMKLWGGFQCLGADTQVLTRKGWVRIVDVGLEPVWDGVDFVPHCGAIYRGYKQVAQLDGVWLTPDHRVLTTEGWREASQCAGLHRAACWLPEIHQGRRIERETQDLASSMHMRPAHPRNGQGIDPRQDEVLRMQERRHVDQKQGFAWHGAASRLRRVALDESALSFANAPSMEKLWRSRHQSLSALVARVQIFLGRHASWISSWLGDRSREQRARLHAKELPLDYVEHKCSQPTQAVYDLVDCGPRHRFVVRAYEGARPFIAHNCENVTQAEAASVLRWAIRELFDNGWPIIGHTHDELLCEIEDEEVDEMKAVLQDIMTTGPAWAAGLPLRCEISSGYFYGK